MKDNIFIGMTEISGYYSSLTSGLRERGYSVTLAGASSHIYEYDSNTKRNPLIIRAYDTLLKFIITNQAKNNQSVSIQIQKNISLIALMFIKIILFLWAILNHKVFIFGFASSFFPGNWDLVILKLLKKRIICNIAHGSDARPPYINGVYFEVANKSNGLSLISNLTKKIKKRCLKIEKYSDVVVGAPLSSHFLENSFINTFNLGVPFREIPHTRVNSDPKKVGVRVLHCPSNPIAKGTPIIRETVTFLKKKGYEIDFIEVIGQPNSVVLEELQKCDFVIDQLYSDFPMAGFATEAAWFAKPAVVGGYGWDVLKQSVPSNLFPPSQICHPDHIESAIEQLIVDEQYRRTLGEQAKKFVASVWSIQQFTDRYLHLVNGDIPEEWWSNPGEIPYVHGCGIQEKDTQKLVSQLIDFGGREILKLGDKPTLEKAFMFFSTQN